jgi:hypothetical protein
MYWKIHTQIWLRIESAGFFQICSRIESRTLGMNVVAHHLSIASHVWHHKCCAIHSTNVVFMYGDDTWCNRPALLSPELLWPVSHPTLHVAYQILYIDEVFSLIRFVGKVIRVESDTPMPKFSSVLVSFCVYAWKFDTYPRSHRRQSFIYIWFEIWRSLKST